MKSTVYIFGSPRSGTTWVGKIFDSHSNTLLHHEPDTLNPTHEFPHCMSSDDISSYMPQAQSYLQSLTLKRQLRIVANLPYFAKSYRSETKDKMRRLLLYCARILDTVLRGRIERKITIPDLFANTHGLVGEAVQ